MCYDTCRFCLFQLSGKNKYEENESFVILLGFTIYEAWCMYISHKGFYSERAYSIIPHIVRNQMSICFASRAEVGSPYP